MKKRSRKKTPAQMVSLSVRIHAKPVSTFSENLIFAISSGEPVHELIYQEFRLQLSVQFNQGTCTGKGKQPLYLYCKRNSRGSHRSINLRIH